MKKQIMRRGITTIALVAGGAVLLPSAAGAAPTCTEDGLQLLEAPVLDLSPLTTGGSNEIHRTLEENLSRTVIDPLLAALGLPALEPTIHEIDCEAVIPVEDAVDGLTIPIVSQLLGGLFG